MWLLRCLDLQRQKSLVQSCRSEEQMKAIWTQCLKGINVLMHTLDKEEFALFNI